MTLQDKDFYRVKEICAALNISRMTLWKRIKKGSLPALERINCRVAGYSQSRLQQILSSLQRRRKIEGK